MRLRWLMLHAASQMQLGRGSGDARRTLITALFASRNVAVWCPLRSV
jgi:hypothetical protein